LTKDARAFFDDFYTTENATLVVSGDFETAQARAWISQYFGGIARRITATVGRQSGPRIAKARVLKVAVPLAEHPRISMVWAGPKLYGAGAAELELFAHLLSPSGANLLGRMLKDSQFDVRDVQVRFRSTIAGTWLELHVVAAAKPRDLQQLALLVQRVLKSYAQSPLHATELSALARSLERYALFSLQSASNQAHLLAVYDHLFLDPLRLRWALQRFQQIVPRGVQSTIRDYLGGTQLVIYALPSEQRRQP
jgi:zinc protease